MILKGETIYFRTNGYIYVQVKSGESYSFNIKVVQDSLFPQLSHLRKMLPESSVEAWKFLAL